MIPLINDFDKNKKAIINPEDIFEKNDIMPKLMISCFTKSVIDKLASRKNVEIVWMNNSANGAFPIYKTIYKNQEIGFYLSFVGAPSSVSLMEELIALGAEKFVVFGSCGVLDKNIVDGHIIIPHKAIRDEGTSFHYQEPSTFIEMSEASVSALIQTMEELEVKHLLGTTWTTDAFYRETEAKMKKRIEQGCVCVEMECSAMLAVSQFRNISYAQFLFAADNLNTETWDRRGLHIDQGLSMSDVYIEAAMMCVLKL